MMTKRGMSLVELLVAMLVTCLVGYIAFDLIRDENGNYTKTRNKVRLQADAREAIRVIEEDLANISFHEGLVLKAAGARPNASPIYGSLKQCDDSLPLHKRVEVSDNPSGSDTIVARFFDPDRDTGAKCGATSPYVVRYLVNSRNQLVRDLWTPGKQYPTATQMVQSIILDSVSTLQVEADLDTLNFSTASSVAGFLKPVSKAETAPIASSGTHRWALSGLTAGTTLSPMSSSGDSGKVVSGWSTATSSMTYTSPSSVLKRSSYNFSCLLSIDQAFANLYQAVSPLTGTGTLRLVLYSTTSDTLVDVEIRRPAVIDGPTLISVPFRTNDATTGFLHITLQGRTVRDTTLVQPSITLGAINVVRTGGVPTLSPSLNNAYWQNGLSTSAFNTQIKGLRVWLVAKSRNGNHELNATNFSGIGNWIKNGTLPPGKNSYAVYERIIPVVHHGY